MIGSRYLIDTKTTQVRVV